MGRPKPPDAWASELIDNARECEIPVFVKDNYGYREEIKEFAEEMVSP